MRRVQESAQQLVGLFVRIVVVIVQELALRNVQVVIVVVLLEQLLYVAQKTVLQVVPMHVKDVKDAEVHVVLVVIVAEDVIQVVVLDVSNHVQEDVHVDALHGVLRPAKQLVERHVLLLVVHAQELVQEIVIMGVFLRVVNVVVLVKKFVVGVKDIAVEIAMKVVHLNVMPDVRLLAVMIVVQNVQEAAQVRAIFLVEIPVNQVAEKIVKLPVN